MKRQLKKWVKLAHGGLGFEMELSKKPRIVLGVEFDLSSLEWTAYLVLYGRDDDLLVFADSELGRVSKTQSKVMALAWMRKALADFATILEVGK